MADIGSATGPAPTRIRFHYIKGQFFRVAHADGVIGGITPQGLIHAAFYSERPAIPQTTEHELSPGGLGAQLSQEGKEGLVRELDVDIIMTRAVAASFKDWLERQIAELDKVVATAGNPTPGQQSGEL